MPDPIAILGSGNMGRALGTRLAATGYPVFFGSRRPEQAEAAASTANSAIPSTSSSSPSPKAQHGSILDAAKFGKMLIWTMREQDPHRILGPSADVPSILSGKIIIDLNNRDYATEVAGENAGEDGKQKTRWFDMSLGEQLQESLRSAGAKSAVVVKAFNTVAMEALDISASKLRESGAQIFVASTDDDGRDGESGAGKKAREQVAAMTEALGWKATDLGSGPAAMRGAEALGDIIRWMIIKQGMGGRANIKIDLLPEPDLGHIGERQDSQYH